MDGTGLPPAAMTAALDARRARRRLPWLLGACAAASLGHFAHNAEYLAQYPNLPAAWTRLEVYVAWIGVTALGLLGYGLDRRGRSRAGLAVLAVYGALGLGGLLHYTRAPFDHHSPMMNLTIGIEAAAAVVFLLNLAIIAMRERP